MNLFIATDLIYRKENRVINGGYSIIRFLSPYPADLMNEIKTGAHVRIRLVSEIFQIFPRLKDIYNRSQAQAQQSLLFNAQSTQHIRETVWVDSKNQLLQLLKQFNAQSHRRRFESLTLQNSALNSTESSDLEDLLHLMAPNAQYLALDNVVAFENGSFLSNTSYFGNFFLLSHELAHPLDPCFLGRPFEGQYWYPGLVKYLRNEVGIKDRSTSYLRTPRSSFYLCGPEDEIGEAAADAIATEVFAMMLESKWSSLTQTNRITAVAQALRPFRGDEIAPSGDTHLSTVDRYKKIILKNPRIRRFLGCRKG